jgi:predicted ATP-grasp superfamily ATP-dependent carboligase
MTWKGLFVMALGAALVVLVHEWVTGGGLAGLPLPTSWEREGRAMRRAIARDFAALPSNEIKVVMTLDARLPEEPGPWDVVRIAQGEHDDKMHELSTAADFTVLVAPETSGVLARLTRDLERAGVRVLGSSARAVDLAGDKLRLAGHLRSRGIETPPSLAIVPSEGLPALARYPAVLKPVDGAGSVNTFYLDGPADLPEDARAMPRALLQPFVPGEPMSASFLVSTEGRAWLIAIGRQRMDIRNGRFEYRGGEIPVRCPDAIDQLRGALGAIEGLRGFVGIDFIWDQERGCATILEINPRPTTSLVGLCRLLPAGRLARAWLEAFRPAHRDDEVLESLFGIVHSQNAVVFDAAGEFAGFLESVDS